MDESPTTRDKCHAHVGRMAIASTPPPLLGFRERDCGTRERGATTMTGTRKQFEARTHAQLETEKGAKGERATRTDHYYSRIWATLTAAAVAASFLLLASVKPAEAAFPGKNGKIAFSSDMTEGEGVDNPEGDYEIFTINPDGTGLKQLTSNDADDFGPDYSADGKWITFTSTRDGDEEIYVMKADGSDQENLSNTPGANDSFPVWSPDGKRIAFTSDRDGNFEVYKMRADGSDQKDLSNTPDANELLPDWSPDGNRISFASDRDSAPFVFDIFKMKADGSGKKNLTSTPDVNDLFSAWSPDGKQIAFDSARDNPGTKNFDIFKMRADGSGKKSLTNTPGVDDYAPSWKPRKK